MTVGEEVRGDEQERQDLQRQETDTTDDQLRETQESPLEPLDEALELREVFAFTSRPHAVVNGNNVRFSVTFSLPRAALPHTDIYLHWGSYDELPERWVDSRIKPEDIRKIGENIYSVNKNLKIPRRGHYGATFFAKLREAEEQVWLGKPQDDVQLYVAADCKTLTRGMERDWQRQRRAAKTMLRRRLLSYQGFERAIHQLGQTPIATQLPRLLFEMCGSDRRLAPQLVHYHNQAVTRLQTDQNNERAEDSYLVANLIENIGLGEVVLVAPEGPHAIAGGLAQVVSGLLSSLSEAGIAVTLISPLYEYAQGSKHGAALDVLRRGIKLNGAHLDVQRDGEIDIPFGPTYQRGTRWWRDHAHTARATVYRAEHKNVKILLLRSVRYADRLYPPLMPDEQLRRAIFLSRGALEVLKNPAFGLHPHLILSNDWLTALVPVLLKLDARYRDHENLGACKTIHLLHNCGKDYHGRIPAVHNNAELWPLLELSPEHFYGCADPSDRGMINLTAGALLHLDALLAVSKPYAQQLLTPQGGEGLHGLVNSRRGGIFGISNGIDQKALRQAVVRIGENAMRELGQHQELEESKVSSFAANLQDYKDAAKRLLQRRLGLEENSGRVMLSFVARLAEQKGIQLLSWAAMGDHVSVLESVLQRNPEVQFVIAGPPVEGDGVSNNFRCLVQHLAWKYRGRLAAMCNFIPHEFALEILTASDFSLMPSRYEPGGLTQLESLACGTLVVARNVGGISATLKNHGDDKNAFGFLFNDYTPTALRNTISWAIGVTHDRALKRKLMLQAALAEHDWRHRLPQYLSVFQLVAGVLNSEHNLTHLAKRLETLQSVRP